MDRVSDQDARALSPERHRSGRSRSSREPPSSASEGEANLSGWAAVRSAVRVSAAGRQRPSELSAEPESYATATTSEAQWSDDDEDDDEPISHPRLDAWQRDIIKCCVAYFLASLFTFVSPLADALSAPFDSEGVPLGNAHFVATAAAYFHPARSIGGLVEALSSMIVGLAFALFVSTASMGTAVALNRELEALSHCVVLVVFIGGSFATLAYTKSRVNRAVFDSACSLALVVISAVVCREGAVHLGVFEGDLILQMVTVVFLGTLVSSLTCLCLWPVSSTPALQAELKFTAEAFGDLLGLLGRSFLGDDESALDPGRLKRAAAAHEQSFTRLKQSLEMARLEFYDRRIADPSAYVAVVDSLSRTAQHLASLRSSCLQQQRERAYRDDQPEPADKLITLSDDSQGDGAAFEMYRETIGPSLRTLVRLSRRALRRIAESVATRAADAESASTLSLVRSDLQAALQAFSLAHARATKRIDEHSSRRAGRSTLNLDDSDEVYNLALFSFALEETAREIAALLDGLSPTSRGTTVDTSFRARLAPLRKLFVSLIPFAVSRAQDNPFAARVRPDLVLQKRSGLGARSRHTLWRSLQRLRQPHVFAALKVGVGSVLLAAPAFVPSTRPVWVSFRGEWAMISFAVVCSLSTGGTTFLAFWRISGTILGATVAVVVWHAFRGSAPLLAGFGLSGPFLLITQYPRFATTGRFVLLSYNLSCLYSVNRKEDVAVVQVALTRCASVCIGTLWAFVVMQFFPYSARHEMRQTVADFLDECAQHLLLLIGESRGGDESPVADAVLQRELHLQRRLIEAGRLLTETAFEPRLQGRFPQAPYRLALELGQKILDSLHAMRCLMSRDEWAAVEFDFFRSTDAERRELFGAIVLTLSLLGGSVGRKSPLSPFLPPLAPARERALAAARALPAVQRRATQGAASFVLYSAHEEVVRNAIEALEQLGELCQEQFGTLGGQTPAEFDALFESASFNERAP